MKKLCLVISLAALFVVNVKAQVFAPDRDGLYVQYDGPSVREVPTGSDVIFPISISVLSGNRAENILGGVRVLVTSGAVQKAAVLEIEAVVSAGGEIHPASVELLGIAWDNSQLGTFVFRNKTVKSSQAVLYLSIKNAGFKDGDSLSVTGHGITMTDYTTGQYGGTLIYDDSPINRTVIFRSPKQPIAIPASVESSPTVVTAPPQQVAVSTPVSTSAPEVSISFEGFPSFVNTDRRKEIADLYVSVLGRKPLEIDEPGLKFWDGVNASTESIGWSFQHTDEFRRRSMP